MRTRLLACFAASCLLAAASATSPVPRPDPCAIVSGKRWVLPKEARACMSYSPLDPLVKANVSLYSHCCSDRKEYDILCR